MHLARHWVCHFLQGAATFLSSLGLDPSRVISNVKCALNDNDNDIGEINQVYPRPDFGRGIKKVGSDPGSFILTYTITPSDKKKSDN
jgi:hypothetical protein